MIRGAETTGLSSVHQRCAQPLALAAVSQAWPNLSRVFVRTPHPTSSLGVTSR